MNPKLKSTGEETVENEKLFHFLRILKYSSLEKLNGSRKISTEIAFEQKSSKNIWVLAQCPLIKPTTWNAFPHHTEIVTSFLVQKKKRKENSTETEITHEKECIRHNIFWEKKAQSCIYKINTRCSFFVCVEKRVSNITPHNTYKYRKKKIF